MDILKSVFGLVLLGPLSGCARTSNPPPVAYVAVKDWSQVHHRLDAPARHTSVPYVPIMDSESGARASRGPGSLIDPKVKLHLHSSLRGRATIEKCGASLATCYAADD